MNQLSPTRRRVLIFAALLGMLAYLALALRLDGAALRTGVASLGFTGVAAVLGLSLINYLLRFARWHYYLHCLGETVPLARHGLYYFAGFGFTVSPGKAGEAVRALYLRRHKVSLAHTMAVLFAERLLDLLAVVLLAVLCAGTLAGYQRAALILGGGVLLGAWLLGRPSLVTGLHRLAQRSPKLASVLGGLSRTLVAAQCLLQPSRLFPALVLGLVAWGAEGYGLYLLASALQVPISVPAAMAIYALGVLGGVASFFMPGGLGGMEAVVTSLIIKIAHVPLAIAGCITVLCRFATLWFAVALGLLALLLLELLPATSTSHKNT